MTRRPITATEFRAVADALDGIEATIREMAAEGRSATDIARAIGHNLPWALRHMRRMDLPVRSGCRPAGKFLNPHVAEIRAALESGQSIAAVATKYGVTKQAISYVAIRHGFPIRAMRQAA